MSKSCNSSLLVGSYPSGKSLYVPQGAVKGETPIFSHSGINSTRARATQ